MQPLTCKELINFLDDYLSDNLAVQARAQFDSHLARCRACRDYLHTYRETITLARASGADPCDSSQPPPDPPAELLNMVMSIARNKPRGPGRDRLMAE